MHGYVVTISIVAGVCVFVALVYLVFRIYKRRAELGTDAETVGLCPPSIILTSDSPGISKKRLYSPIRERAGSKEKDEKLKMKEKRKDIKSLWLPKKKTSLPVMQTTMVQPAVPEQTKACQLTCRSRDCTRMWLLFNCVFSHWNGIPERDTSFLFGSWQKMFANFQVLRFLANLLLQREGKVSEDCPVAKRRAFVKIYTKNSRYSQEIRVFCLFCITSDLKGNAIFYEKFRFNFSRFKTIYYQLETQPLFPANLVFKYTVTLALQSVSCKSLETYNKGCLILGLQLNHFQSSS